MSQSGPQKVEEDLELEESPDVDPSQETAPDNVFIPPSIDKISILSGRSYTYHAPTPRSVDPHASTECVLGVDEAGRGPVLGPMVYSLFYLPVELSESILTSPESRFSDSKVLTPAVLSNLMRSLCTPNTPLQTSCGWSTRTMSARDISAGMLKRGHGSYNLNAQAMDATIKLIQEVYDRGVNIREVYVDTIGAPATYQQKLERVFPTAKVTVSKKADSLYPVVSAASVCAKVTRDAALKVCHEAYESAGAVGGCDEGKVGWGSGYPSDSRTTAWLKRHMDPLFGWGSECRFSWSTAKELLESKSAPCQIDWLDDDDDDDDDDDTLKITSFMGSCSAAPDGRDGLADWFGQPLDEKVF